MKKPYRYTRLYLQYLLGFVSAVLLTHYPVTLLGVGFIGLCVFVVCLVMGW